MQHRSRAVRRALSLALATALTLPLCLVHARPAVAATDFLDANASGVNYRATPVTSQFVCGSLAGRALDAQTRITSAQLVPATSVTPAFCDVLGVVSPSIKFEVALPVAWNQRLYVTGNGGLAGDFLDTPGNVASRNLGIANGFAFAHTDTGHSTNDGHNGTWAVNRPDLVIDWAYRAIHVTNVAAKALVKIFYSQDPRFTYFSGCSDGGREGFEEAQRFPEDFNGIVAGAPWINPIDTSIWEAWIERAFVPLGETTDQLVAKMQYVSAQVYAKCDALDGVQDGLITDPRRCIGVFNPAKDLTICPAGTNGANCVTAAELAAYEKTISPIISGGRPYYPPAALGTNYVASIFSGDVGLSEAMMRYIFPYPASANVFSPLTFNFESDPFRVVGARQVADVADAGKLRGFLQRGGKMLTYTGWSDQTINPFTSVGNYENLLRTFGTGLETSYRLFMVPGMTHCAGGVGPDTLDPMTPVINWVERGVAPETLFARKLDATGQNVLFTRNLCPYPMEMKYIGGSTTSASSFRCGPGLTGVPDVGVLQNP